jgi:hypothetical protein
MPNVTYRFNRLKPLTLFVGIGPRIYLLKSTVRGSVGSATIGDTTEKSTSIGFGIPLGAEFRLGPGSIFGSVLMEYGGLDHTATGDTNTGAISLTLGYRLFL